MKSIKIICLLSAIMIFGTFQSCKKDHIEVIYKQEAGIYFKKSIASSIYTFVENQSKIAQGYDICNVFVEITGDSSSVDREFTAVFDKTDTLHTAEDGMFELQTGIVKAGEFVGVLPIRVNYSTKLDAAKFVARIDLVASDIFPVTDYYKRTYSVELSNTISKPENWDDIDYSLGNKYSDSWYSWTLKASGLPSFPYKYFPWNYEKTKEEAERWWMSQDEFKAHVSVVKKALIEYNSTNKEPLRHEDGKFKDQEVTMP